MVFAKEKDVQICLTDYATLPVVVNVSVNGCPSTVSASSFKSAGLAPASLQPYWMDSLCVLNTGIRKGQKKIYRKSSSSSGLYLIDTHFQ